MLEALAAFGFATTSQYYLSPRNTQSNKQVLLQILLRFQSQHNLQTKHLQDLAWQVCD